MATILFFDDWPLAAMHNVRRVMGKPRYVPEATLEDAQTEGTWNFPYVWHDSEDGKWKALYCGAVTNGPRHPNGVQPRAQTLNYAESDDGIHWQMPDVQDRANHNERRDENGEVIAKNIVYSVDGHIDGAPVWHDPNDEQYPLKYLFAKSGKQGMAGSPDGIEWHDLENVDIGDYNLDSPITAFYNHYRDSYIISRRLHCGDRRVSFFETKDWKNFALPEVAVHPDPEDPPLVQYYGMPVYRYENVYIGLLWYLYCHPTEELVHKGLGGPMECALTYSYDGWRFLRATHDVFVPRNERGDHGGGCVYCGAMVVDDTPQIRFYSGGSKAEHFQDQWLDDAALMLHTLRLDGFFRLESYVMKGYIITRTVQFSGPKMQLNVRAPHGQIRVRITNRQGEPIEGFDYDDCEPFTGDELFWEPVWKSDKTLDELDREAVHHIEVELTSGEIYAIRGDFQFRYGSGLENAPVRFTM